jgi:hypothetical protein
MKKIPDKSKGCSHFMKIDIENIVMVSDMAKRWGVDRRVINNWISRDPSFPKPFKKVGAGKYPLYHISDMIAYGRLKGLEKEIKKGGLGHAH